MSGNKDYRTYIYYMLPINDERILIIAIYYVVCSLYPLDTTRLQDDMIV